MSALSKRRQVAAIQIKSGRRFRRPLELIWFLQPCNGWLKGRKNSPRMPAFGLQRPDERQLKFFRAREKLPNRHRRFDFWQPYCAALFDGFNRHLLTLVAFVGGGCGIKVRGDALRQTG